MWRKLFQKFHIKERFLQKNRFLTVSVLVIFGFGLLLARLFFLQILHYSFYADLANRQQNFTRILEPKRGDIYFQSKNGELMRIATTQIGAALYINTKNLKNPDGVFETLNKILPIDKNLFYKIVQKKNDPYEVLKHRVSIDDAEKISALNLSGVGLEEERWRYYPAGSLASHVVGFVSQPPQTVIGQYGVEKYFDKELSGSIEKISGSSYAGSDIVLTIEPEVEKEIEKTLQNLQKQWKAAAGGILILEPKTGRITAMAAYPSFDPNNYQKENLDIFLNPFTQKIFELGSVFKPLTMSSALNEGALTPETTYLDKGEVTINGRTIKNYDGKARGVVSMIQVLEESLNTGAVFAMERVGGEKLRDYFHKFGLGDKTGIELPGELHGDLSNLDSGREVEFATAAFGQGVAVTSLELAMALAALGNGGKLMEPHLLTGTEPKIIREVIKPETSVAITSMLITVVDKALAGGKVKMEHYSIAAKTGTAQIPASRLGGGKGYSDQYLHSYFGYFPAYDPRFLIFMFLDRPQGIKYASQSLSDTFRALVEFLINYYTIVPDR